MASPKITTPPKGFTPAFMDNLKSRDQRLELADKARPGLRLRLDPSGRKTLSGITMRPAKIASRCHLTAEEIKALWQALDRYARLSQTTRLGLKILLLTGMRTNEPLSARWDHINFDTGEWFIPEENSKTTAWTGPLVPPVRALFHELKGAARRPPSLCRR